jgi:hypothetical protein
MSALGNSVPGKMDEEAGSLIKLDFQGFLPPPAAFISDEESN